MQHGRNIEPEIGKQFICIVFVWVLILRFVVDYHVIVVIVGVVSLGVVVPSGVVDGDLRWFCFSRIEYVCLVWCCIIYVAVRCLWGNGLMLQMLGE